MIQNTFALIFIGAVVSIVASLPVRILWKQKRIDRDGVTRLFSTVDHRVIIAFGILALVTFITGPVWMYVGALLSIGVLIGSLRTKRWFMKQYDRNEQHSV